MADNQFSGKFPPWLANYRWPLTYEGRYGTSIFPGIMRSHTPNSRQQLVNYLNDTFYDGGRKGDAYAENIAKILDFPLGAGHGSYEVTRATAEDRLGDAAISLAMAAIPPPVKKISKEGIKTIKDAFRGRERSIPVAEPEHISNAITKSKGTIAPDQSELTAPSIIRPDTRLVMPRWSSVPFRNSRYKWASGKQPNKLQTPREVSEAAGFDVPKPAFPGRQMFWQRSSPWIVSHGPLARPPRPFSADYPKRPDADENGRLLVDRRGNPLTASRVAGRNTLDGPDVRMTPEDFRSLVENDMNAQILRVRREDLVEGDRSYADAWYDINHGPEFVQIWEALPEDQAGVALGHEAGHLLDYIADEMPTKGLKEELNRLYSEAITGRRRSRYLTLPGKLGYSGVDAPREKWAEAFRVYSSDANTMKAIAPKTADAMMELNTHPFFSKYLQFNSVPLGIAAGAGAATMANQSNESQAEEIKSRSLPAVKDALPANSLNNLHNIATLLQGIPPGKSYLGSLHAITRALLKQRRAPSHGGSR